MDIAGMMNSAVNWPFLKEPIWRWFVFLLIIGFMLGAQRGMLRHME